MGYKIDLLKKNDKSIFRLILGIFFWMVSTLWIKGRWTDHEVIRLFDWFYAGIFTLMGFTHFMAGFGIPIGRFFGKAFVHIDNEMIDIKLGAFEKEFKIDWQEIESIDCESNNITIQKQDNSSIFFPISKLDYFNVTSIKDVMSKLAESKNIKFNI